MVGIGKKGKTTENCAGILIQVIKKKNFNVTTSLMLDFIKEPIKIHVVIFILVVLAIVMKIIK